MPRAELTDDSTPGRNRFSDFLQSAQDLSGTGF